MKNILDNWWEIACMRWGRKRFTYITWIITVGLVSLFVYGLETIQLDHSGLLYILTPYLVSLLIFWFKKYDKPKSVHAEFWQIFVSSLAFLLATSVVLREGFICVIFLMPIYFGVVFLAYLMALIGRGKKDKNRLSSVVLPLLILTMSLEGTTESLSLTRDTSVESVRIVDLSIEQIKTNLARPFDLKKDRNWLLEIFPMPYQVDVGSLNEGEVHKLYTRYHRWFVGNTHEGSAELVITKVSDSVIEAHVQNDSTYFSNYLSVQKTRINLTHLGPNQTEVSLRIEFVRHLDPAWYFRPLQQYAVKQMANHLIIEVMLRESQIH